MNGCLARHSQHSQHSFVNRLKIAVSDAHYPSGTSKWNPIEHRVFSEVSKRWAGIPLESFKTVLQCLRTTGSKTGLTVTADLVETGYSKGIKISDKQTASLSCVHSDTLPKWIMVNENDCFTLSTNLI